MPSEAATGKFRAAEFLCDRAHADAAAASAAAAVFAAASAVASGTGAVRGVARYFSSRRSATGTVPNASLSR